MSYDLVFTEAPAGSPQSALGKSVTGEKGFGGVLFKDLPADCKVYAFYYPGAMSNPGLENKLRELGESTGKNLFVNIGQYDDDALGKIEGKFQIDQFPVIIVTAMDALASPPGEYLSVYARLDNRKLLGSPERTIACVQEVFSLFLQGRVADAVSRAKWQQRAESLRAVTEFFAGALKSLGGFVAERDISISLAEGKFELKRRER